MLTVTLDSAWSKYSIILARYNITITEGKRNVKERVRHYCVYRMCAGGSLLDAKTKKEEKKRKKKDAKVTEERRC